MTSHPAAVPAAKPKSKETKQLSSLLDHRIAAYALVATATAAAAPAFGQAGSNSIVHTPATASDAAVPAYSENVIRYTPAHISFSAAANYYRKIGIDFGSYGVADITFTASARQFFSHLGYVTYAHAALWWQGSAIPNPIPAGRPIGPNGDFENGGEMTRAVWQDARFGFCLGLFKNVQSKYLGVRFSLSGETHYGWVELSTQCYAGDGIAQVYGTITGYAYNTIPNETITTGAKFRSQTASEQTKPLPRPGTLRALSLGAAQPKP